MHPHARKASEVLLAEHRVISSMLVVMDHVCALLSAGEVVADNIMTDMIRFIELFTDGFHHAKEETVLFTAYHARGVATHEGPVALMTEEHRFLRNTVERLSSAWLARDLERVVGTAREYVEALRAHIHMEEEIIFPMGDAALSPEEHSAAIEAFVRSDRGHPAHELAGLVVLPQALRRQLGLL